MRNLVLILAALVAASPVTARTSRAASSHHGRHAHRAKRPARPSFSAAEANDASRVPRLAKGAAGSAVLRAQVLLDRARFSVGEIDGRFGENMTRAVRALRAARGLPAGEEVDAALWEALDADAAPVVAPYTVTPEDVAGPFTPIPADIEAKAALPSLSFTSPLEELGERFHCSPKILEALNPGVAIAAGATLQVPQVARLPLAGVAWLRVSAGDESVEAFDAQGRLTARYPATVGSEHDPLPVGEWKVRGVSRDPKFHYNPELFWDAEPGDRKTTLPAGPNSPVGVVWIDLSKPHYGIHGTEEPSLIGHTASHGCIRLTNWDAWELANAVKPGIAAELVK